MAVFKCRNCIRPLCGDLDLPLFDLAQYLMVQLNGLFLVIADMLTSRALGLFCKIFKLLHDSVEVSNEILPFNPDLYSSVLCFHDQSSKLSLVVLEYLLELYGINEIFALDDTVLALLYDDGPDVSQTRKNKFIHDLLTYQQSSLSSCK